jgi:hypothetical protein
MANEELSAKNRKILELMGMSQNPLAYLRILSRIGKKQPMATTFMDSLIEEQDMPTLGVHEDPSSSRGYAIANIRGKKYGQDFPQHSQYFESPEARNEQLIYTLMDLVRKSTTSPSDTLSGQSIRGSELQFNPVPKDVNTILQKYVKEQFPSVREY